MSSRQSAEERKTQIVAAVLKLADEIGPDRLSTTDVARAIGLSQPAIFRHFPTKNELWLEVAEYIAEQLKTAWSAAELFANGPNDRLKALIEAQLSEIAHTPALPSILFSRELQVENPGLRNVFREILSAYQSRLVSTIRDQQASGYLQGDESPEDIAILLTSLVQGIAIRWTLGARGFSLVNEGLRLFDVQMALLRR